MHAFNRPQDAADWLRAQGCIDLHSDSRRARSGDGLMAWPGARHDPRDHIRSALNSGVKAALVEANGLKDDWAKDWKDLPVASMADLKHQSGPVASAFYSEPSQHISLVAVTGTNGKTTVTWWLAQALNALDQPCGIAGTLGVGPIDRLRTTGLTTLQSVELHSALADMRTGGLTACTLEASSIGIAEGRLNGTHIAVAIFTNLTQDHLDYHGDMANYWDAKKQLMHWPQLRHAVVNIDDAHGAELARDWSGSATLWTTSVEGDARLRASDITVTPQGTDFVVTERDAQQAHRAEMSIRAAGTFNVSNALQVLAALRALGVPLRKAVEAFSGLSSVPGRLQRIQQSDQGPWVLVDYAHTPDAVAQVLQALRPAVQSRGGQLWCVLGCGGNRDASKRAPMAAAAEAHAERVVLTSDNPRDEDPEAILLAMQEGLSRPPEWLGVDRAQAIAHAIAHAKDADVVVIAGKGHEDYQEVKGQRLPFNDADVAQAAWQLRMHTGGRA